MRYEVKYAEGVTVSSGYAQGYSGAYGALTTSEAQFNVIESSQVDWQAIVYRIGEFSVLDESLTDWQAIVYRIGKFSVLDSSVAQWQALVEHVSEFNATDTTTTDWFGGVDGATQFVVYDRSEVLWSGTTESYSQFEAVETSIVEWSVAVESGSSFELLDTSTATWDSHIVGTSQYSVIESSVVSWRGYVEAVVEAIFSITDKTAVSFRSSSLTWRNIDIVVGNLKLEFEIGIVSKSYVFSAAPLVSFDVDEVRLIPRFILADVVWSRLIVGNVDITRLPVSAPAVSISVGTPFI